MTAEKAIREAARESAKRLAEAEKRVPPSNKTPPDEEPSDASLHRMLGNLSDA